MSQQIDLKRKPSKKARIDKEEISGVVVANKDDIDNKKEKKEAALFNDKNVDYNLYHEAPENVATKK